MQPVDEAPLPTPIPSVDAPPAREVAGPTADAAPAPAAPARRGLARWWWVAGIGIAVLVVVLLSPFASGDPDGLERVAEDAGFIDQAENWVGGLLGDYAIPGVDNGALSTILSGLLGLLIVVGILYLLGRVVARRRA